MDQPPLPFLDAGPRLFLVEDHEIMVRGLSLLLGKEGFFVCGTCDRLDRAEEEVAKARPDAVVVDLVLAGHDALPLIARIHARLPSLAIVVYSAHEDPHRAARAFRAGARAYVSKGEKTECLIGAIRAALAGRRTLGGRVEEAMLGQWGDRLFDAEGGGSLSDREREVHRLLGEGRSTREIAVVLHLSPKTVETYYAHLKEKLGLRSTLELRQHAIANHEPLG